MTRACPNPDCQHHGRRNTDNVIRLELFPQGIARLLKSIGFDYDWCKVKKSVDTIAHHRGARTVRWKGAVCPDMWARLRDTAARFGYEVP